MTMRDIIITAAIMAVIINSEVVTMLLLIVGAGLAIWKLMQAASEEGR